MMQPTDVLIGRLAWPIVAVLVVALVALVVGCVVSGRRKRAGRRP